MDFSFTRTATETVRRLSDQFSQAQDHILLKNRLKIKEVTNCASENLNGKNTTKPIVSMYNFPDSTANLIFFGFLIILPIFDRQNWQNHFLLYGFEP